MVVLKSMKRGFVATMIERRRNISYSHTISGTQVQRDVTATTRKIKVMVMATES